MKLKKGRIVFPEGDIEYGLGFWKRRSRLEQLTKSSVEVEEENYDFHYHHFGWPTGDSRGVVIQMLGVNKDLFVPEVRELLGGIGYRPAVIWEVLFLLQEIPIGKFDRDLALPYYDWSKMKMRQRYILLERRDAKWFLTTPPIHPSGNSPIKPEWKIPAIKVPPSK